MEEWNAKFPRLRGSKIAPAFAEEDDRKDGELSAIAAGEGTKGFRIQGGKLVRRGLSRAEGQWLRDQVARGDIVRHGDGEG